ncbi:hypothetical protein C1701_22210 [Actinoalloteichus sp. AHMU CJ021]|uniref:Secreted protein n=1 Tax=Actinoalloteichus caeruleus DSM 43889 TaxID=1120930 RepID=A0ABT1JBW4_ACTCY|nr:hypothetical protein [Actinoalloteichus caeruleus]AUS80600.1 hypothetical protein C1701_22210 [Actinoalloteichus sp. AHMU CJ021]MCP2329979.1 hypothetical protein [Actinoalloteichus caeruleus DSM 43889]
MTGPATPVTSPRPARRLRRRRSRGAFSGWHTTPGRLSLIAVGLVVASVLAGLVGAIGAHRKAVALDELVTRSEPLSVAAQDLYAALSDADATAATSFLTGGTEPAEVRDRYSLNIARAAAALTRAAHGVDAAGADAAPVTRLAAQLPIYAGLVETARANHRQGNPVGAAYLRLASGGLMQQDMLPEARELYQGESAAVSADRERAAAPPVAEVTSGLVLLAGLVGAQLYLHRRTRRVFNIGLVGATLAAVAWLGWLVLSHLSVAGHLEDSRVHGSDQVNVLASARIAALEARTGETLVLVAQGTGQEYEEDFDTAFAHLLGEDGNSGLLGRAREMATDDRVRHSVEEATRAARSWLRGYGVARDHDRRGEYDEAVAVTVGHGTTSGDGTGGTGADFGSVERGLHDAVEVTRDEFAVRAAQAQSLLPGQVPAALVLAALVATGSAVGIGQRVREYR